LGHPCKFQRVSRLGSVTARHLVVGVSQTLRRPWTCVRQGDHHVGHWPTFLVLSFFQSTDFSTPLNRFSWNSATRRGMFWNWLRPYGVFICAPKNWGAKNTNFCQFADPQSTLWAPTPFHNARKSWKSKTRWGSHDPRLEIGCPLGAWDGAGYYKPLNLYNFGCRPILDVWF